MEGINQYDEQGRPHGVWDTNHPYRWKARFYKGRKRGIEKRPYYMPSKMYHLVIV
jgi:hypothetical protein